MQVNAARQPNRNGGLQKITKKKRVFIYFLLLILAYLFTVLNAMVISANYCRLITQDLSNLRSVTSVLLLYVHI